MQLSVVIPALNEAPRIETLLLHLRAWQARGAQLIVVDGGSADGTDELAARHADRVIATPRGRALQMNAGARAASGEALLFLHADSLPPPEADLQVISALAASGRCWGRFDVQIAGDNRLLPVVAMLMNWRSRLTGIATGDQGMFMTRGAFDAVGGFPAIPLMEDIAMSRALKRLSRPACLRQKMATSGRRWERQGALRTVALMWRLRAAYFFGADPAKLAVRYHGRED
jgi:rSAM/selenodomain-associated transferase 2